MADLDSLQSPDKIESIQEQCSPFQTIKESIREQAKLACSMLLAGAVFVGSANAGEKEINFSQTPAKISEVLRVSGERVEEYLGDSIPANLLTDIVTTDESSVVNIDSLGLPKAEDFNVEGLIPFLQLINNFPIEESQIASDKRLYKFLEDNPESAEKVVLGIKQFLEMVQNKDFISKYLGEKYGKGVIHSEAVRKFSYHLAYLIKMLKKDPSLQSFDPHLVESSIAYVLVFSERNVDGILKFPIYTGNPPIDSYKSYFKVPLDAQRTFELDNLGVKVPVTFIEDFKDIYTSYMQDIETIVQISKDKAEKYKKKYFTKLEQGKTKKTREQIIQTANKKVIIAEQALREYNELFSSLSLDSQVKTLATYEVGKSDKGRFSDSAYAITLLKFRAGIDDLKDGKADSKYGKNPLRDAKKLSQRVPALSHAIDNSFLLQVAELQLQVDPDNLDAKIFLTDAEIVRLKEEIAQLDTNISQLDTNISQLDTNISQLDTNISQGKEKIAKLNKLLSIL